MPDFGEPHDSDNGFAPEVCEGCPYHETAGVMDTCGLCGCPTGPGLPMDQLNAPPESCIRLDEHAEKAQEDDSFFDSILNRFSD